jgi:DNA-binding LacI/PurR family transcriptional regulator
MEELGRVAMSTLLEILNGAAPAIRTHVLPTSLVVRGSTAPPGARSTD